MVVSTMVQSKNSPSTTKNLVGGFKHPFENDFLVKFGSFSPKDGVKIKKLFKTHHLEMPLKQVFGGCDFWWVTNKKHLFECQKHGKLT